MGKQCGVCRSAESKYKCPHCFTPYCSIACYHKHKEVPCLKPGQEQEPAPGDDTDMKQPPRSFEAEEDDQGFRLRRSQLEAIAASDDVRTMLRDQNVQKLIQQIDSSVHPEKDLDKAMEGTSFRELCDKILGLVNPEEHSHVTQA